MLNDAARALLESNAIAQLITINVDGSPQVSGVWVGLDGDELVIASLPRRIKVRNVQRDPRVALVVQSPTKSVRGLDEYLLVHGTARVTEGGAPELLQQLAHIYLGPDAVFPGPDAPAGYIFHVMPEKFSAKATGPASHHAGFEPRLAQRAERGSSRRRPERRGRL